MSLIQASELPLSVLIVGVGQADFSQMDSLDADRKKLSMGGRIARRDIVQFVALKDFATPGAPLTTEGVAAVSRQLLAEIPQQLLEFMEMARILPNPRPTFPPPAAVPVAPVVGLEDVHLHPHGATAGAGATV